MSDDPRNQAHCTSCGKAIDWTRSAAGQLMPVDVDSAGKDGGNLAVTRHPNGDLTSRVITADAPLGEGEVLGLAHWASCPKARAHRRARR